MTLLEIKNLDVFYGKIQALKNVSLYLEEGECVGVVGPVTSGKTTLLDSILNLTNWRGRIIFDGIDLSRMKPVDIVKKLKISYVTEREKIFTYMTVIDNLIVGAYSERKQANENLKKVFKVFPVLKERQQQMAGTLSGGQQQMLALGKALMLNPRMLLLDEPTLGLDISMIKKVFEAVSELKNFGTTLLIAEQNMVFTTKITHRIYFLKAGEIIGELTTKEIKDYDKIIKLYFGF